LTVVKEIKNQYARILLKKDARHFKSVAEHYLDVAARLKKRDIRASKNKLLLRNSQKRLFLGIGCELLLKAYYLKNGYCINKFTNEFEGKKSPIHKISDLNLNHVNPDDSFTMGQLIDGLKNVGELPRLHEIERGFKIAMTFRNKEGHVSFPTHEFDDSNYSDIESSFVTFYKHGFDESLVFKISMKPNEKAVFRVRK